MLKLLLKVLLECCDCGLTYKLLSEQLTGLGYVTTVDECKNAKRAKLPEHAVPVTARTIKFVKVLLEHYPAMDLYRMFPQGRLDEVMMRIAD